MSKVIRQHYVPQFYLRQWHNEKSDEQIYVYNKELQRSYSANIEGTASSRYFYDYPELTEEQQNKFIEKVNNEQSLSPVEKEKIIANINEQVVEKGLSEIEGINNGVISSIISKLDNIKALPIEYFLNHSFLNDEDILELSYFIALQFARTEEMRIVQNDITKWLAKITADTILQNIDKLEHDEQLIEKMGGKDSFNEFKEKVTSGEFNSDSYTVEIDETYNKISHISSIFEHADNISKYLMNYKWLILINNTDIPFITTDNPVAKKNNLGNPYAHGFASKGIEIYYPISPKYAITIWEPSYFKEIAPDLFTQTIIEAKEANVIHNNDLLIQTTTSQIYSNINDFTWVEK